MKKVIASAGVLALGALSVQSVRAQQLDAVTERPWSISGTLRGFYDDNYNTQPDGVARKGSAGIEIRPQATVGFSRGPTTLNASYTYDDRYFFSRPGNKNDQSHDFEFTLLHSFNERYSVDALESFVDSQEPEVVDPSLSFPLRANGDNFRNSAAINFHAEATKLLGFVFGYANNWYDYTGSTAGFAGPSYGAELNRFEHLVTLDSRWRVDSETVAVLGYQFGAVDFTSHDSIVLAPYVAPSTRNDYTHSIYVGVDKNLRSDLTFSLHAGVQIGDYYNAPAGTGASSIGPYVDLSSQYTYMENGFLTLGFRHSINQTDVPGYNPVTGGVTPDQESSSVYMTLQQTITPLSPKLIGRLSAQYQNSRFNGGLVANDRDVFYLLGLNLSYQFTHFLSAEVGYNYDDLVSQIPGRAYDRNRVYVGVTATY